MGKRRNLTKLWNDRVVKIEREFGQPILEVIKGFAADGESMLSTASMLELNYKCVIAFANKNDIKKCFREMHSTNSFLESARTMTPAKRAHLARISETNPTRRYYVIDGIRDTIAGHCRRIGISERTVYDRFRHGLPPEKAFFKGSFRRQPRMKNKKQHPWYLSDRKSYERYERRQKEIYARQ